MLQSIVEDMGNGLLSANPVLNRYVETDGWRTGLNLSEEYLSFSKFTYALWVVLHQYRMHQV